MPKLRYERHVRHTPGQMLDLVADVEAYPLFVPNCSEMRSWPDPARPGQTRARMHVRFGPITASYTSDVTVDREAKTLRADAIDGPFSHLLSGWRFVPEENGTRVIFDVDFGFSNPIIRIAAEHAFAAKQDEVMDAFMRRAGELYGKGQGG